MSNNIDELKKQIEEIKNEILTTYKNLIVSYDDCRELYEKIIAEYEADDTDLEVVPCSKVIAKNSLLLPVKFQILLLNGTKIYESDDIAHNKKCHIDLNAIKLQDGSQFLLKAITKGKDPVSTVILKYEALNNGTAIFELKGTGVTPDLEYIGTTYPITE